MEEGQWPNKTSVLNFFPLVRRMEVTGRFSLSIKLLKGASFAVSEASLEVYFFYWDHVINKLNYKTEFCSDNSLIQRGSYVQLPEI